MLTPPNGGPVDQRLFLFDPQRMTWRVASKAPTELSEWPFLIPNSADGQVVISSGTTLIYNPATDTWRSVPAPVSNMGPESAVLADGLLVQGTGPLYILNVRSGQWSTSGPPPGPLVGDGTLVATDTAVFAFGITTNG